VGLIVGCRGPEGPVGPGGPPGSSPIFVTGSVQWPSRYDTSGYVFVQISNVLEIPAVYVNDIEIPFDMSNRFYDRDFPIFPGDSARLRIEHTKYGGDPGVSEANIRLPALFTITSHDTSGIDTIPFGNDLTIIWSSSEGADAYLARAYFFCRYDDTTGVRRDFNYQFSSPLADTSITFLSSDIFPDTAEVDTVYVHRGDFFVSSFDGPWQQGEANNVTGDGIGTFHGWTEDGYVRLRAIRN